MQGACGRYEIVIYTSTVAVRVVKAVHAIAFLVSESHARTISIQARHEFTRARE